MAYNKIIVPREGTKITINDDLTLNVPNDPIIPFIEGDGIGIDIIPVMKKVVDAAVQKAYGNQRKVYWMEVYCGEKASKIYEGNYLPEETVNALNEFVISIKGPLASSIAITGFNRIQVAGLGIAQEERQNGLTQAVEDTAMRASIYEAKAYYNLCEKNIGLDIHKYAGQNKVNPIPLVLSAKQMLFDLGWTEASQLMAKGIEGAIVKKTVTFDYEPISEMINELRMEETTVISCSEFGDVIMMAM